MRSTDDDRDEVALLDLARVADVRNAVPVEEHAGGRVEREVLALRAADQRLESGVVTAFDLHGEAAGVRAGRSRHLTVEDVSLAVVSGRLRRGGAAEGDARQRRGREGERETELHESPFA